MKRGISSLLVGATLFFTATVAGAQQVTFQTASARLTVESSGMVSSLTNRQSGQEELHPTGQPIATVTVGGREFPASSFKCDSSLCHVGFGTSGITAYYRVSTTTDYLLFEVAAFQGGGLEKFTFFQLSTSLPTSGGQILAVRWDSSFALSLIGLSQDVETSVTGPRLSASLYPQFGISGRRIVLVAQPPSHFLNVVEEVEQNFHLVTPAPMIDNEWAKFSPAASSNYLFTDLTEANVDNIVRYARAGQIPYILILASTWATSFGSYPINRANYPHGEAGLKAVVDKLHAAGIRVGLHMLTDEVSKTDSLVHPVPNPGLLKVGETTLSEPVNSSQNEFSVSTPLNGTPTAADLQIDNEIFHCSKIVGESFSECQRGYSDTVPSIHSTGAHVLRLAEADNAYLADLRSPLLSRISERIAGLINGVGFDMVDFDGGELNSADGPGWYWVGLQQYEIWKRVHRDILVQGSGITPWSWHFFTRGISDDFASVGVKENFQLEKINFAWNLNYTAFLPAELGWVGLFDDAADHPATMPDEMELYAARGFALNSGVGVETFNSQLNGNGRSGEMLDMLRAWQKLRNSSANTPETRSRLGAGEWHLTPDGKLHSVVYETHHFAPPSGSLVVNSDVAAQPLRFRLRAVAAVASPDNAGISLLQSNIVAPSPAPGERMPGALIRQVSFPHPLNLVNHRAMAVRVDVEGAPTSSNLSSTPPAVINIQLRDTSGNLRDYYLDLSFRGSKMVEIPTDGASRMLAEFWPAWSNYPFKSAIRGFNYSSVGGLALRWMRYPPESSIQCTVQEIEVPGEQDARLSDVEISSGPTVLTIPGILRTGDYAEYWADGSIRIYDHSNFLLRTVPTTSGLTLQRGETKFQVHTSGTGALDLTVISLGPSVN